MASQMPSNTIPNSYKKELLKRFYLNQDKDCYGTIPISYKKQLIERFHANQNCHGKKTNGNRNCRGKKNKRVDKQPDYQEKQCALCKMNVEGGINNENMYGILDKCCCTFCLSCIKQYRLAEMRRTQNLNLYISCVYATAIKICCPRCGAISKRIMPSAKRMKNSEAKADFIKRFKKRMEGMRCQFYRWGYGACPFGMNCNGNV